jgi:queuine tRNA-ribosyltransferase
MENTAPSLATVLREAPLFLPDATYGVVRATDAADLEDAGVRMLMVSAFHLMRRPGISTVKALGGLKQMMGWRGPVATDSGGFQAYSLIRENPRYGKITDDGLLFTPEDSDKTIRLTPRRAIETQMRLGADLLFCLDDCTHPREAAAEQAASVRRTIAWARECKVEFARAVAGRRPRPDPPPRLFAVIQGGRDETLRRDCAQALIDIGFDGFGYGGWPLDEEGALLEDMLALTRSLVPRGVPLHALGVGHPASIAACARMGYTTFDSALPTRDARRGRLYAWRSETPDFAGSAKEWFQIVYMQDELHLKRDAPLSATCQGLCCQRYSTGYLHHLFKINDALFARLATIHNLNFMTTLMAALRPAGHDDGQPTGSHDRR